MCAKCVSKEPLVVGREQVRSGTWRGTEGGGGEMGLRETRGLGNTYIYITHTRIYMYVFPGVDDWRCSVLTEAGRCALSLQTWRKSSKGLINEENFRCPERSRESTRSPTSPPLRSAILPVLPTAPSLSLQHHLIAFMNVLLAVYFEINSDLQESSRSDTRFPEQLPQRHRGARSVALPHSREASTVCCCCLDPRSYSGVAAAPPVSVVRTPRLHVCTPAQPGGRLAFDVTPLQPVTPPPPLCLL